MKFAKLLAGTAIAVAFGASTASATTILTFGIQGTGNYIVNTGDITAATTTKTIPTVEKVNGSSGDVADAGISQGDSVTFSTLTFNTVTGLDAFTLTAGDLVFSFTDISSALLVASGPTTNGSISEQFNGSVTGDSSVGQMFLDQTASISETCTQTDTGATITCSESLVSPGLPTTTVPEPTSLALLGAGLVGFGLFRRRRKTAYSNAFV